MQGKNGSFLWVVLLKFSNWKVISAFVNISVHIDSWEFLDDLLQHLLVKDYDNDIFKSNKNVHLNMFYEFPKDL